MQTTSKLVDVVYRNLVPRVLRRIRQVYGKRLITVAVFGSYARREARPGSDLDLLIIAAPLPNTRYRRIMEFVEGVEIPLRDDLWKLWAEGIHVELSPVIKSPEEVQRGSPLFLDMTEAVWILYDKGDFLQQYLKGLQQKLRKLGAKKTWFLGKPLWILKPDFRPGEIVEL